jgi:hypothetical protein
MKAEGSFKVFELTIFGSSLILFSQRTGTGGSLILK